jgi:uncharacterized membrane protein
MATAVNKAKRSVARAPRKGALELALHAGRRLVADHVPSPTALRDVAEKAREHSATAIARRVRTVPIQCSVDVAVPLEVAYEEWMALESLPEGAHRVVDIERDGDDYLIGRLSGVTGPDEWEAEIRDERPRESFAWRSVRGSDCAGLVTFHRLAERLTRLELQLDVAPVRIEEAIELMLHLADHRAEAELRRFKARLETINPDDYPPLDEPVEDDEQADDEEE